MTTGTAIDDKASAAPPRPTYQDVLDAPEHKVAEIIDGTLYTHPRPTPRHATATSVLGNKLGPAFHGGDGGPGGWRILDEPELHLGEKILVPDLAGWRRERTPDLPATAYFTLAPDWAYEVLSASTRKVDLLHKRPIYGKRCGTPTYHICEEWSLMTLSMRRVNRCRILNEGTWPNGIGRATGPMKRGRAPTYLASPGPGGAGAPSTKRGSCARASGPGTG